MKTINVYFDDEIYKVLEDLKKESGLSWRKFIIKCVEEQYNVKISSKKN